MMEWVGWAVRGWYSHSSRFPSKGGKRDKLEIWAKHSSMLSVSYLSFTCYIETIVKSTQCTWQRVQLRIAATRESYTSKSQQIRWEKAADFQSPGSTTRRSSVLKPTTLWVRLDGATAGTNKLFPSLLLLRAASEGDSGLHTRHQRLIWGKTQREIEVKFLWTLLYEADHMTRFSRRNAETLVLQATHQLITMPFYQAYPHSINNAPGQSFI